MHSLVDRRGLGGSWGMASSILGRILAIVLAVAAAGRLGLGVTPLENGILLLWNG